jgi:hypothetical protein
MRVLFPSWQHPELGFAVVLKANDALSADHGSFDYVIGRAKACRRYLRCGFRDLS